MTDQLYADEVATAPVAMAEPKPTRPSKKDAWFKAKRHTITLPSGTVVEIELPNVPALIKSGKIPNELLELAIGTGPDTEVTREMIEQQAEFYNFLVATTVKDPELTPEEVNQLPYEDIEMIVAFALRQRDMDAVYRHMSGLDRVSSFRKFRRLDRGDATTNDL